MRIFVDMDGVLTDFDKKAGELFGTPRDKAQEYLKDHSKLSWFKINNAGKNFWSEMDWMPDGKQLWESITIYRPTLLSSPSNHPSSRDGKKKWVENKLGDVPLILAEDKGKYAEEEDDILIDDREKNISEWKKAGGIGILHKNTRDTLDELRRIISSNNKSNTAPEKRSADMKWLVEKLDKIASSLEANGLVEDAIKIDIISNTIDKMAGEKPSGKKGDTKGRSRPNPIFDSTSSKVLDGKDHFPINDIGRARNALARVNQYSEAPAWYKGSLEDLKKTVVNAVKRAYPSIEVSEESYKA